MISVDFEKLKELYEIVNRFQGSVSENLSRAEAQTSGITADGDKLLRHLNEIKRFLDDEISRYQRVERNLNNKANAITFRGSKALSAVYINNISENVQVRAANVNAEAFIPLVLNGDAGLESKSSELKLKSENVVDKTLKAADEKANSAVDMVENTANEIKNFAEEKINELGQIEKLVEGKIDEILGALVKELNFLESEIYKALSDKDLEGLKENGVDLVKIKVEEFFTFDKNESKEFSKEEEKYKNNLEEDWDNFKSNIWNEFKKDHPEVVKKLEEIKNQIEAELKTAWNNFKKDYPIFAQILKVSYKTVKGIIEGGIDVGKGLVEAPFQLIHLLGQQFYDFKKDPLGTAKKWLTIGGNIYTLLNGMSPLTQEQAKFRAGLVQMVRTTIDKNIIHGDAESRSRFITNVAGNIAIFVFTDGAGAASKAGEAGEVVEEVSNGEKAEEALNTIGKTEDALNTAGKAEDAVSTAGRAESWWSKLEAPLKTFSNFNKEFSKAANTLKACINTKVEEVFTIVKETKDLGKSILYKLRDPVNEVKEIILPKRELTENQERILLEGCFTGKTLINTELGLRRIDSIKEGEKVYAENAKTGQKSLKKVLYVYKKHSKDIIIITIGKEKLETTAPHLFYTEEGFKPAERIKAGEKIKNNNGTYEKVIDISTRHAEEGEAVYNLNVEDYHTYFVGEGSLLVHNDCSVSNEEVKTVTDAIKNGKVNSEVTGKEAKDVEPSSMKEGEGNEGAAEADLEVNQFNEAGKLKPNIKYKAGEFDYLYETDEMGRISKFETDNLKLTERKSRLPHNPDTPGKLDGDHAGHLAGDRFGGSPELDNLVSQSSNVNLSQYKKIENQWATAIKEGKQVKVNVEIKYDRDDLRPSEFNVQYEIDGKYFERDILN